MKVIYKYSIKTKLILMLSLSALIALMIAITSSLVYDYYDAKQVFIKNTLTISEISAKNITAALTFSDEKSIKYILLPMLEKTDTKNIFIYNEKGQIFTILGDPVEDTKNLSQNQTILNKVNMKINFDYIDMIAPIYSQNEKIGYVRIVRSTNSMKENMFNRIMAALIISFITILIVILLSFKLEKIFLEPIFNLLDAMKKLESNHEHITLIPYTKDEFRDLFLQFNLMVDEINKRDEILNAYNLDLKSLVDDASEKLEKVSILAITDVLTGLYNRRHIMDTFDTMIKSAQIKQEPLGIIMLDIDHFKSVNDTLGHGTGDLVLKAVADVLQKNARADNIVGRIGGEEFLIFCPNCDTQRTFD
ncbi:MAG: diguanylate cyclase, partial [Sulfurovum sp.]|nr:diguanylate cyclase [Sulfurovum sp.]